MQLEPFSATLGFVRGGEYQYFLYRVNEDCGANCSLIISLSTYTGGNNPTLVVSRGMTRLPTLKDHDVMLETHQSEVLTIEKADLFMHSEDLDQLNPLGGYWVLGVYGAKNTTFQIGAVSQ
jgi:hypothetical protein